MTPEVRNALVLWMMGDCFRMDTEAYKGYYQRYAANGYRHIKSDPVYQEMAAECRLRYPESYFNYDDRDMVYMGRPSAYARQELGSVGDGSAFNDKRNIASSMWQNIKGEATSVADIIKYIPEALGELAADTKIAYDYWQKMKQAGDKLVNTFGPRQGADIDNYYHPLLQCELAKISPASRDNGIALGYIKEYLMDYPKKRFLQRHSHDEIMADSRKDLQNNLYGSNLGNDNPNRSCEDLLDDRRTTNMRKLGIR